jgi:hypothetical protein
MSVTTEPAPASAADQKADRRAFTQKLIEAHRTQHGVHPTERLSAEAYDSLGKVLSEQHSLEPTKAVAYVKNIDSMLRSPGKKGEAANVDVTALANSVIAGQSKTLQEIIVSFRVDDSMNKDEVIKATYDVLKDQINSGALNGTNVNALVSYVFKQIKGAKASTRKEKGVPLNDLVLEKYAELSNKFGPEATNPRNQLQGEAATEFNAWYEQIRGGHVGNVERTGERMAEHAQWHLNRLLKEKGVLLPASVIPKPPKPVKEPKAPKAKKGDQTADPATQA